MSNEYRMLGEMDFADADDANIPVNIFLRPADPESYKEEEAGTWVLTADNFMPRKMYATEQPYKFVAPDRATLVAKVQEHWRPLYETALILISLDPDPQEKDGSASLYYWGKM